MAQTTLNKPARSDTTDMQRHLPQSSHSYWPAYLALAVLAVLLVPFGFLAGLMAEWGMKKGLVKR